MVKQAEAELNQAQLKLGQSIISINIGCYIIDNRYYFLGRLSLTLSCNPKQILDYPLIVDAIPKVTSSQPITIILHSWGGWGSYSGLKLNHFRMNLPPATVLGKNNHVMNNFL